MCENLSIHEVRFLNFKTFFFSFFHKIPYFTACTKKKAFLLFSQTLWLQLHRLTYIALFSFPPIRHMEKISPTFLFPFFFISSFFFVVSTSLLLGFFPHRPFMSSSWREEEEKTSERQKGAREIAKPGNESLAENCTTTSSIVTF